MSESKLRKIHKDSDWIITRFCKIHGMTWTGFMDKLANLIKLTIDGIDDKEWSIEELRKYYPYSDVLVAQDIRQFFTPNKEADNP